MRIARLRVVNVCLIMIGLASACTTAPKTAPVPAEPVASGSEGPAPTTSADVTASETTSETPSTPLSTPSATSSRTGAEKEPTTSKEAVYNLPIPSEPQGQIRIASLGMTDVRPGVVNDAMPVLHLRVTIRNDSSSLDWNLDARMLQLRVDGAVPVRPTLAKASNQPLPFLRIPQGKTQTLDVYYMLPPEIKNPNDISNFTIAWEVTAGDRLVSQTTTFDTIGREDGPATIVSSQTRAGTEAPDGTVSGTTSTEGAASQPYGAPGIIQREWWLDPFADLPEPWRERVQ